MLAKTFSATVLGVEAQLIEVEVDVAQGLGFMLVGLPDNAVKEAQQRVEAALRHNGLRMPRQKVVVNLAPADLRKEGSAYDLPLALGVLKASGQIEAPELDKFLILGELSLDGILRPIRGALPMAIAARKAGLKGILLPKENAGEAGIVDNLLVYPIETIKDAVDLLEGEGGPKPVKFDTRERFEDELGHHALDFRDVRGQTVAKRALEIAAAGGHNVLMVGPPGSGKTMLAQRLPTILPPLSLQEALETTKIHSVAGKLGQRTGLVTERPFRAPHHTISDVALVGGGSTPQPGEISLAHNGVLFLDEFAEFKRQVLEVLRQPLEERQVTIARAKFSVDFPANFMLIASMNPSPSGEFYDPDTDGDREKKAIQRYLAKVSGPLLDRIDLHLEVSPVSFDELSGQPEGEDSATIRQRVIAARKVQRQRYESNDNLPGVHANAQLPTQAIRELCPIPEAGKVLLKTAMERRGLSARSYDRILKVARTIADLSASESIGIEHLAEAIQLRSLDREDWLG